MKWMIMAGSFLLASTLQLSIASTLAAAPPPSARQILESVRTLESRQHLDLQGQLRENDKIIPFHLTRTGPVIRYSFENPDETFELRLDQKGSQLDVVSQSGTEAVPATKLDQPIRDTGISYEDLALKFLY